MNDQLQPGVNVGLYAPNTGNQCRSLPKTSSTTVPRKKYGMAWKNVEAGISASSLEPRVQPSSAPATVPKTKLKMVDTPISPTVHGTAERRIELTGADSVIDTPRLPWMSW